MPGCYPYGVRAMWSERSRHMRGGAVLGSSGKVAGLAVRFLARDMRLTGAKAAGTPAALVGTGEPHVLSIFTFLRKKLIANSAFLGDSVGTPVLRDALSGRR